MVKLLAKFTLENQAHCTEPEQGKMLILELLYYHDLFLPNECHFYRIKLVITGGSSSGGLTLL
jgi:hypothetical protein